jgi:hypothetical protein
LATSAGVDGINKGTDHIICKRSTYFSVILYKTSLVCVVFIESALCFGLGLAAMYVNLSYVADCTSTDRYSGGLHVMLFGMTKDFIMPSVMTSLASAYLSRMKESSFNVEEPIRWNSIYFSACGGTNSHAVSCLYVYSFDF